jgi:secondary thiamine-phosphate synthase enzyme
MKQFTIRTGTRSEMIDITQQVRGALQESRVENGVCYVFVPHTTAGITINENADNDVQKDILAELDKVIPLNDHYRHSEGNSAAHIKSSLTGASVVVPIDKGQLVLGTWQSIFFCEFDGPRSRRFIVKVLKTE